MAGWNRISPLLLLHGTGADENDLVPTALIPDIPKFIAATTEPEAR